MVEVVPPAWLDERALAVWERLAPDMVAKGVLTAWDVDAFAQLCTVVVIAREALADIAENGSSCKTVVRELSDGTLIYDLRKNPSWQIARESMGLIVSLGGRFGLNPSDRSGLTMDSGFGDKDDDLLSPHNPGRLLS
ncbi:phage terminase small subunit P27 family [Saccharothrix sp. NRRL B-16314]|uniref:phage terminase small subunit P27 family n=1 Tax=Saccharothrix sp. NRRL B-16314 TaxID=1463825 RepID=UPI0006896A8E|nr:phage terminase small subunit P27 family [Saccharothrix sp. NRRL B-16314]